MKNITKYLIIVAGIVLGFACVKEPTMSATEIEQRSLKAWIEKYHPELLENYQEEGGYYVEILDRGVQDSLPITGKDAWLWVDFTARDLQGNVCETRSWAFFPVMFTDQSNEFLEKDFFSFQRFGCFFLKFRKVSI